ncbi:MAG TPA: DNA mismatch repair endonuclease MutL, partial [Vicinamibacteria bacterium]|nr:DNA mismatch repair endonuclease MutL [Vicinamibacteria bacterium]
MTRVQRLGADLVNKIAAGEVVERPASVVKELVENALDAEARAITVEVEGGGKTLVRVRDDGTGMARDDAELALERHATSKLRDVPDLERIATHGFRGEALPSIGSVSELTLRTHDGSGPAGTEIGVRFGERRPARDVGHPRGTTVEVRDLFGSVPARRKFLRADATESAHVADAVTTLALAHPGVGFTLRSAGRVSIQAPATDGLAARVFQVLGGGALEALAAVERAEGPVAVRGFVSRLDRPGAARPTLRVYVNGRAVRDRGITRAIAEAYRESGAREVRGDAILFVEVPLDRVDVNVHPAKTEVRFADARGVWAVVQRGVRDALASSSRSRPAWMPGPAESGPREAPLVREAGEAWAAPHGAASALAAPSPAPVSLLVADAPPTVLGQHRNTYVVATDGEDLLLIDQHTAHERARFEQLSAGLARRAVESQMMLVPQVVELSPRAHAGLAQYGDHLRELGFDVEAFGGSAVRVAAVPAVLAGRDVSRGLEDL